LRGERKKGKKKKTSNPRSVPVERPHPKGVEQERDRKTVRYRKEGPLFLQKKTRGIAPGGSKKKIERCKKGGTMDGARAWGEGEKKKKKILL